MNDIKNFLEKIDIKIDYSGKLTSSKYPDNMEDYIKLSLKGKTYYIYEIHRSERILVKEEKEKEKAVIWAVIYFKKNE